MYARSTTILGKPESVEAGIGYVRDEVMPALLAMDGCGGMSMVVERATGRAIVTSAWQSMEAMEASAEATASMRTRGGEVLGGEPSVAMWEIALMHRDHRTTDASCCRISWGRADALDASVARFRDDVLPMIESTDGFCSASMFVDRSASRLCGTVTFDSMAALESTRDLAEKRRQMITEMTGLEFTEVAEFDLVLAHLRVPESV